MEKWEPGDGSEWIYLPDRKVWRGTYPRLPDTWLYRTVAEFRYAYPQAPHWDGWLARTLAIYGPQRWIRWLEFEPHWWTQ